MVDLCMYFITYINMHTLVLPCHAMVTDIVRFLTVLCLLAPGCGDWLVQGQASSSPGEYYHYTARYHNYIYTYRNTSIYRCVLAITQSLIY